MASKEWVVTQVLASKEEYHRSMARIRKGWDKTTKENPMFKEV